jgi:hypothetical protein
MITFPPGFARISSACLLACSTALLSQSQQSSPSLDEILSHVEARTEQYKASVPSFLCDEHILSQEFHQGQLKHETTVDALFRVTRSASQTNPLTESREIKAVNGKPSTSKKINMPISFTGGFSGALAKFLSADHRRCFDYRPDSSAKTSPGTAAFTFTAKETVAADPACASIQPQTTGKFVVDSVAMQVTHIERTVPYPIGKDPAVLGTASVEFAPFTLSGKLFWLPSTITAYTSETPKTNSFRFTASYSNYHRFSATSIILPAAPVSPTGPDSR